jgi:circadian clock protein KaiC
VLLQYVKSGADIKRAVTVLKTRASWHQPTVRGYEIGEGGIQLGPPMVLTNGATAPHS